MEDETVIDEAAEVAAGAEKTQAIALRGALNP